MSAPAFSPHAAHSSVTPDLARSVWRAGEPVSSFVYFAPERFAAYADIGLEPKVMGYFAARSAAMGAVGADTVAAVFSSFNPAVVRMVIPKAWSIASPETVVAARLTAVDKGLRAVLDPAVLAGPEIAEAAELARTAASAAAPLGHSRPLFAAHAGLDWPTEPHLVLWHAVTLLREFRGDGHLAALLFAGLDPLEASVTYAGTGERDVRWLLKSRGWAREQWDDAVGRLRDRDIVARSDAETVVLTDRGRSIRAELEDRTDVLSLPPFEAIGVAGCARLIELLAPVKAAIVAAGLVPGPRKAAG
ncbi:hypothetical protein CLV63_13742 [Murinocardiopsis flavida]|uniref:SalK n=1 Tax=Murinocardiopsis flavida TaxID=645275 RepID=A0A2P8CM31_9ACTN|nr:hypothetical protein [Murinocardiopsis flavida]PSK85983.1 hypothetical protein CLV63_13742 [Murinocardiopsis flavida]